ncbi:unknown [Gryllus bimaculatus nudivirus]|uniref:Uncharacterized protein n=1 Tax=Gryllus bimaculatus nudivirus TaxID=432587 RepID=A4L254_9VIRU|nr:hypothetical protein GrBNV_gp91 [Gryllus bimaculatus nudivirus]ABO45424.1 unknown [Gryllus bimaculatus nudivirus]
MDKYNKCYNIFIESNYNNYRDNGSVCDYISIGNQRSHSRQMLSAQSTNFVIEPSSTVFETYLDSTDVSQSDERQKIFVDMKKYLESINDSSHGKEESSPEKKEKGLDAKNNNNLSRNKDSNVENDTSNLDDITSRNEYSTNEFDWLTQI